MNRFESSCLTFTLRWILPTLIIVLGLCVCPSTLSQEHPYLGSAMMATHQRLQAPSEDQIHESIGGVIETFSRVYDLPMWLDRQIARDQIIAVEPRNDTLELCLRRVAERVDSRIILLDNLVFFAPNAIADTVELSYWDSKVAKLPGEWSTIDRGGFRWKQGASSIEISNALCQFAKLDNTWTSNVEHDHWAEHSFSKVNRLAIATAVSASLGKRLRFTDGKASIEELIANSETKNEQPRSVPWQYKAAQIVQIGREYWNVWKTEHPTAIVQRDGDNWLITASPGAHRALVRPLIPMRKWTRPKSKVAIYSLKLQGTLEYCVDSLVKSLKLDLSPLPLPDKVGKREVQVDLKDATVDVILRELGKAGGLEFRKSGERYEIQVLKMP